MKKSISLAAALLTTLTGNAQADYKPVLQSTFITFGSALKSDDTFVMGV